MNRYFFFSFLFFLLSMQVGAQKSIQSTVFDVTNGMALELATVRLLEAGDSSLVKGAQTNTKGWFQLTRIQPGNYILKISSVGYNEYTENVTMERKDIILKNIQLAENVQALQEIDIKGTAAQLVVKGDTLEYNATAFKVQENAVVEDLLKRLPGVEITTEGKITVNGEEIKKFRVDGKKFFDGDVEMATKNLPAEMIDKIQVLEQKSDMAELTGFEDEETERIINLTTKPNRRKGVFGNTVGGVGMDTENTLRYDVNANINLMQGDAQTSVVAGANNVNTTRSRRGRGSWGANNGITVTQNFGLNNNTLVNDKFKIGGDGSFNHSTNYSETRSTKESYVSESIFNDSTYNESNSDRYESNMRLEAEWKPDSLTTLILQPNINYSNEMSGSYRDYVYLQDQDTSSYGVAQNANFGHSLSAGLRVIFNRKFPSKPGRTFTTYVNSGFSQNSHELYNFSTKIAARSSEVNQYTRNASDRFHMDTRISFVEPLWNQQNVMEAVLAFSTNTQSSIKDQYASDDPEAFFNQQPEYYTDYVEEYSNQFKNRFYKETAEVNYRYKNENHNLTLGVKGEPSQTYSYRIYGDGNEVIIPNYVFNFAPNGRFQYNFGKKEFMRMDYRGRTRQPSITQMQPVKNNANLMRETVGNPHLNPSFSNYMRLMYSKFNDQIFSSFSTWLSANYVKDELVSNRIYDSTGKQYNQTVNSSETPMAFNGNVMFNTPIIQKRLHFNTSTNVGYNTNYGYTKKGVDIEDGIDTEYLPLGDMSFTRRYSAQERLSLTFTHDVIELGTRGMVRYSNSWNNVSSKETETYDWTATGNIVLRLPYDITISSDINYTNRMGYSSFDQSELIWNASIDKSVFKNRGVVSVKWVDLLRQQLNIRQVVGDNSVSFTKYNTLTSYFLVSFSYRIRQFGGSDHTRSQMRENRPGPGIRSSDGQGSGRRRLPM